MNLISYLDDGKGRIGFLIEGQVIDLMTAIRILQGQWIRGERITDIDDYNFRNWCDVLQAGEPVWRVVRDVHESLVKAENHLPLDSIVNFDDVSFLPPIGKPGKILCVGLNYPPPPGEAGGTEPPYPIIFHKAATALTGHRHPISIPRISNQVEYEGELALVIGRRAKNIPPEHAKDWIFGYTIANDIGAADIQAHASQWAGAKMFDTFCPLGPALVSHDEIHDPDDLQIRTQLNGVTVQEASTAEMVFSVPTLVSYISTLTTLEPGDIILTGSPKRVGDRPDPRQPLKPGDTISVQIENLGILTNPVIAEEG